MRSFLNLAGLYICPKGKLYQPGDIVESTEDLVAKHGPAKFQSVSAPQKLKDDNENLVASDLEGMKVGDLRKMADDLKIDISAANNKSEIIALIDAATQKSE